MPNYRRAHVPGGCFFFTLVTEGRTRFLCEPEARRILHACLDDCGRARPFTPEAMVLLPDHLHQMWTLPDGDADFSTRIATVKANFSRQWVTSSSRERKVSDARRRRRLRGVWQRRFWEHWIRDRDDFTRHLNYIHYNPVKHGLVACPHAWPYSTFRKWVRLGVYEEEWLCVCGGREVTPSEFGGMDGLEME